ncbi:adenosylhomocysteinase [Candidatus Bathyarchaeota archaeon]|nr:adenosylhomocysteinase [Candidatus Bathyarchaeota archaeon]MBS7618921.1 adenosylhomocysteinase [Candidatus Bathyarchaeota archaeon]
MVRDINLADKGVLQIEWASRRMPVLARIREEFSRRKPLKGLRISACLHVTKETAVLVRTLMAGGAEVSLASSNPMSCQDDVAAALAAEGVNVYAWRGQTKEEYYKCIETVLSHKPRVVLDDGADLIVTLHQETGGFLTDVFGGCEETTTGVLRLKAMEKTGSLKIPVIAVNNAQTKWDFDNVYGTGQSTLDGVLRATNMLLAGRTVVVAGYGHCGRGIANRAKGMGSQVIVTEVDPIRALRAVMDGFKVMPMVEAAKIGDLFITATGNVDVVRAEHMILMKDGAVMCNAGHFNVEISLEDLEKLSISKRRIRDNLDEYTLVNGRRLYLLAEGRLVNLVAAEGHPSEVMDMSFANQALSVRYLVEKASMLEPHIYDVPLEVDRRVAELKLETIDVQIDNLTEKQRKYLESYETGT